jgi:hypothetical protein
MRMTRRHVFLLEILGDLGQHLAGDAFRPTEVEDSERDKG